jgi:hypothetical protein
MDDGWEQDAKRLETTLREMNENVNKAHLSSGRFAGRFNLLLRLL